jgi:hypothetical protein
MKTWLQGQALGTLFSNYNASFVSSIFAVSKVSQLKEKFTLKIK